MPPGPRGDSRPRLSSRAQLGRALRGANCGALLRRTAGGGCPHVVIGGLHGRGACAYIVSARGRPDLIAYWEEIPVQNECACIADVDGGQLCHPAEACPSEAVPAGADAGALVPLQSGLRWMR